MLTVEVEYLTGVARAANEFGNAADWPPQPDRLFSALVATWSARGEHDDERAALEWLERAAPPVIEASHASSRRIANGAELRRRPPSVLPSSSPVPRS